MKEDYNNFLKSIDNLNEEEQLKKLKSYRKKLINIYNKKFNELFEIKYSLAIKDSKYDDLYNDDTIEEMYQEIEYEDYNTIDECKNIIEKLIIILEKTDEEIKYCNGLVATEAKVPKKVDMDVVNSLNKYVPLLAEKSLSDLKKEKNKTPKNDEMYILLDRAIEYKKNKRKTKFNFFGVLMFGLFSGNTQKKDNSDLMSWEKEAIKNGNYEHFNFEEQELEEDDYYYDDLD